MDAERRKVWLIRWVSFFLLLASFCPLVWATSLSSSDKDLLLLELVRLTIPQPDALLFLMLVDTEKLEEKMAGFSFNPDTTTHGQLVAFHLQQRLASADRTTPHAPDTPDTPQPAPDTTQTPNTPQMPHLPDTPDKPAAVVCNADQVDSSEELPTVHSMVLEWGFPAATFCSVLLVVWAYRRRSSSAPRPAATTETPTVPTPHISHSNNHNSACLIFFYPVGGHDKA
jgi:hypothetical protein